MVNLEDYEKLQGERLRGDLYMALVQAYYSYPMGAMNDKSQEKVKSLLDKIDENVSIKHRTNLFNKFYDEIRNKILIGKSPERIEF